MISIIVCSISPERLARLKENIRDTIGLEYELIAIDNRVNSRGICAVYNQGAAAARYDILCFVHEDVEFLEDGWGARVLQHFSSADLGAIGLAGSRYKGRIPSGWSTGQKELDRQHLYHGSDRLRMESFHLSPPDDEMKCSDVCVLDGVWIGVRRSLWETVRFDENIVGFHFYDIDFSLRCYQIMRVAVIYDVELLHFSKGGFDASWVQAALDYHRNASSSLLPVAVFDLAPEVRSDVEYRVFEFWLRVMRRKKLAFKYVWQWVRETPILSYPELWWRTTRLLVTAGLGKR